MHGTISIMQLRQIYSKNVGIQLETPISVGRIDVLRLATNEVWDVKPLHMYMSRIDQKELHKYRVM